MKSVKEIRKRAGAGVAAMAMAAAMMMSSMPVYAAGEGLDMSTDYPGITVKAGDTVSFGLDFSCDEGTSYDADLSVKSLPDGWSGYFKGDSKQVTRVHIDGDAQDTDSKSSTDFSLTVPEDTEDGTYTVELEADGGKGASDTLELAVTVSKEEVMQSTFTSEYPEQQGASGTTFSFDTTLVNNRATDQSYSLSAEAPSGWQVTFTPSGESANVASLNVDAGSSQGLTVTVTPPDDVEKGDYTIPISAISAEDTLNQDLSVSITGTYNVSLSTPDGRLSLDAYADKESSVTLSITNNGNVDLTNLNLTSTAPTDWDVSFSESTIDTLEAGATKEVTAYIKPAQDVITGDYVTDITIKNDSASSMAEFRVSVKTPTTWGIVAVAIIVVLVAVLAGIFKKFGRR
ncbi:MAG: NEW3 domain-containing protein [Lachnospiraceae bacterium]|nr:NEW3 domain-containing protein [Lachnospiraceae bacterium]